MAEQFDEIYESWMSNLAAGALATVALAGSPLNGAVGAPPPNPNTSLVSMAQHVNMAVPKERPKSFKEFRDKYMFPIYYKKIGNMPMLSDTAETFAGPRFNLLLAEYVKNHETKGKYTANGKAQYVTHNGTNYVQKVAQPSGGYMIGDGLSLNDQSLFPQLVAPYLANHVAFDEEWKPIISTARIKERIMYLEASTAQAVLTDFFNRNRMDLIRNLSKSGVDYASLDSYAKFALEDLAFNQGVNLSFKKLIAELAKPTPDYVRAAYEMCDCKDWESFGGLRERRINDAHLLLMAADRNNGLDIYKHSLGHNVQQTDAGVQNDVSDKEGMVNYAVSKGDSLSNIAQRFHSTIDEICADNDLSPTAVLPVGKILRIRPVKTENMDVVQKKTPDLEPVKTSPVAKWHTVQAGETFSGIAFKNKAKLEDMKRLNPGINYNKVRIGQKVRVL